MSDAKKKVPLTELPIFVYQCVTHPDRPFIAFIGAPGKVPVFFNGATAFLARKSAKDFAEEKTAKIEAAEKATKKRVAAAKAKREAQKTEAVQ